MPKSMWFVPALLLGMQIFASARTIAPGTTVMVTIDHEIDLQTWKQGQTYPAHVARDVWASDGVLAFPSGLQAEVVARQTGPHQMALELDLVAMNGGHYIVSSTGPRFDLPVTGYHNGRWSEANVAIPPSSTLSFQIQQPVTIFE